MNLFTTKIKNWIIDNWKMSYKEMAKHLGCHHGVIQKYVEKWRLKDPESFPLKRGLARRIPDDQTTWRMKDGMLREFKRTEKGFRLVEHLPTKINSIDKQFVLDNYPAMTPVQLAKHFGVQKHTMDQLLSKMRKEGHNLPYIKRANIGEERKRVMRGKEYTVVMTDTGFVRKKSPRRKAAPKKKEVKVKIPKPRNITPSKRQPKTVKIYKTLNRDRSNQKMVKVDRRTWIYGDKSKSDQEIIDNYYSRRG